jgi:hypothetical protein
MRGYMAVLLVAHAAVMTAAEPPTTLTVGGSIASSVPEVTASGAVWQVYAVTNSNLRVSGSVGAFGSDVWTGDIGTQSGITPQPGSDRVCLFSMESGSGTLIHTGYYAVVNQRLTGDDPALFSNMTLRPIPVPNVSADAAAYLNWNSAVQDSGDGGFTNIVGYNVFRSSNGVNFTKITPSKITQTQYTDWIPNDAEYYYAIGLVYRGSSVVTSSVLSANSVRVFKDSNSDGMPDYFCIAAGLDPEASDFDNGLSGDPNHTGMSNYQRWIAGTFPPNSDTCFLAKDVDVVTTNIVVRWDGVAGRSYTVDRLSNLCSNNWETCYGPVFCQTNQPMSYADILGASVTQQFYRINVWKE